MSFGEYEVIGRRLYRGHEPGSIFEARLERNAERRAIRRGDIRLLRVVQPKLQEGSFAFPDGWLPGHEHPDHRGAERRLLHERE